MRKIVMTCFVVGMLAACSNNSQSSSSSVDSSSTQKPTDPEAEKGLNLVATNDCFGCHNVSVKVKGPAYQDVANRYKDSSASIVDTLANRVIRGTSGKWDTAAMTPHPTLPIDDARTMVKYILSLKQ